MSAPDLSPDLITQGRSRHAQELADDAERWLAAVSAATGAQSRSESSGVFEFRAELQRQALDLLQAPTDANAIADDAATITPGTIADALDRYASDADLIEALLDDLYDRPESVLNRTDDALGLDGPGAAALRQHRALLVRTVLAPGFVASMARGAGPSAALGFHEVLLAHTVFERHRRAHHDCGVRAAAVCPVCLQFARCFRSFIGRVAYSADLQNAIMVLTVTGDICAFLRRRRQRRDSEDSLLAFGAIARPSLWNIYFTVLATAPYEAVCGALREMVALLDNTHNCDAIVVGVQDWWTAPMALYRIRAGDVGQFVHSILAAIQAHVFVAVAAHKDLLEAILEVAAVQLGEQFARRALACLLRKLGRRHFPQQDYSARPWANLLGLLDVVQEQVICNQHAASIGLRLQPDGSPDPVDRDLVLSTLKLLKAIRCDEEIRAGGRVADAHERRVLARTATIAALFEDVRLLTTIIQVKLRHRDNRASVDKLVKQFTARIVSPKRRLSLLTKAAALPMQGSAVDVVDPFLSGQTPGQSPLTLARLRASVPSSNHVRRFRRYSDCWMASALCATLGQFGMSQPKAIRVGLLLQATQSIAPVAKRNTPFLGGNDLFAFEAC